MTERVDRATGEILDQTTVTATGPLAELLDSSSFLASLRELDAGIAQADREIGVLKENLKAARQHREGLVAQLRAVARGDRVLPFIDEGVQTKGPAATGPEQVR